MSQVCLRDVPGMSRRCLRDVSGMQQKLIPHRTNKNKICMCPKHVTFLFDYVSKVNGKLQLQGGTPLQTRNSRNAHLEPPVAQNRSCPPRGSILGFDVSSLPYKDFGGGAWRARLGFGWASTFRSCLTRILGEAGLGFHVSRLPYKDFGGGTVGLRRFEAALQGFHGPQRPNLEGPTNRES